MSRDLTWVIGLFLGIVAVTALVNRVRPVHRPKVRRLLVLFALYAVAVAASHGFAMIDRPSWASTLGVTGELFQALVLVTVVAMAAFAVVLPLVGVQLPAIASDLIVGLGAIAAGLVIFSRHGLNATDALVSGAVVSAVLAISLQSTLGNILGGVALQLDGSIHEGDWIQLEGGRLGRVRAVRWRHTVVEARDFSTIIVPNAQLLANSITILGKRDGVAIPQRMTTLFNVDFRYPPNRVTQVVSEALQATPIEHVAAAPPPVAVCLDLAKDTRETFIAYAVRYSLPDLMLEDEAATQIRARIYAALRRADIPLSVPAMVALLDTPDEVAARRAQRELDQRIASLKTVHLFASFTDDELRTLAGAMNQAVYTDGELITRQGRVANWLYILTAGRAEVRTSAPPGLDPEGRGGAPGRPVAVATISAPDFFGEMGLMTGELRSADVVALGEVECFRLGKEPFQRVLMGRPEIAHELSERLASRRIELIAARDGLDPSSKAARRESERQRILGSITNFFGL